MKSAVLAWFVTCCLAALASSAHGLAVNSVNATLPARDLNATQASNTSKPLLPSSGGFKDSKVWGPPLWFFLHSMTLALPEKVPAEQQVQVKNFVLSLREVLPCAECALHWREQLEEDPVEPHLANRTALVDWMIGMHNKVNKRNGHRVLTREEALLEFQLAYDKFGRWGGYQSVIGDDPTKSGAGYKWISWSALVALLIFHQ
mmetsp:Transcript_47426/g.88740  ORF Transcript_47426/g.88740 Transcript_47426/m.88740 type:complete len:203 (-) Transcript_47426:70-678(-)